MFVMMAQSYVDSLRDNVNRSIAQENFAKVNGLV